MDFCKRKVKKTLIVLSSIIFILLLYDTGQKIYKKLNFRNVMEEIMYADDYVFRRMPTVRTVNGRSSLADNPYRTIIYDLPFPITSTERYLMNISCGMSGNEYGYCYLYALERNELYSRPFILEDAGTVGISGWLSRIDLNCTEADMVKFRKEAFYGCYLKNWFKYSNSSYSIRNLGDIRITGEANGDKALYVKCQSTDKDTGWAEHPPKAPASKLEKNRKPVTELDEGDYKIAAESNGEIRFLNSRNNPYYDETYINLYLNATGIRSYEILFADEKYLCIWKENTEGKQEIVLLDLYQTNCRGEPLSVGEDWEYGFILPVGELMEEIAEGGYRADSDTCYFARENPEEYAAVLREFFTNRKYMYKTYLTESGVGFLVPMEVQGKESYMRLEVEYNWRTVPAYRDSGYLPEELGEICAQNDRILAELCGPEEYMETALSVCMQEKNMMQVKCSVKKNFHENCCRYVLYDVTEQKELKLDDILTVDETFIRWLKTGKKVEGDLTKASYSMWEGREQTLDMLEHCPSKKLEEALTDCEFYLEPGLLHVKLPYWERKFFKSGWTLNGEGEIWKGWLTIRTEDIREFIKVEKW